METLHNHFEMIDLNPLVTHRERIEAPSFAGAEELQALWYSITDKVSYLPGGLMSGNVTYHGCFNNLPDGLQTHVFAPLGLEIKGRWTLGGNMPGEPAQPVELGLGIPKSGLWLREDVDMKCNVMMVAFVKKNLKKSHASLVDRMVEKAKSRHPGTENESLATTGTNKRPDHYRTSVSSSSIPHGASPSFGPASLASAPSREGSYHTASPGNWEPTSVGQHQYNSLTGNNPPQHPYPPQQSQPVSQNPQYQPYKPPPNPSYYHKDLPELPSQGDEHSKTPQQQEYQAYHRQYTTELPSEYDRKGRDVGGSAIELPP